MSGGAGYVLSSGFESYRFEKKILTWYQLHLEALHRFVTRGIADQTGVLCRNDVNGAEDVEMGKCMENLGVIAGDTRL